MSETTEPTVGTALTVISTAVSTILAADKDDILGKLAKEIEAFEPDASTPAGRKAIRSMGHTVARTKMDLLRLADGLTAQWRESTKAVVAEKKVLEERMDALKAQVLLPADEYDAIEKARVDAHLAALKVLEYVDPALARQSSAEITLAIAARMEPPARDWQEFGQRAAAAHKSALGWLHNYRFAAEEREEQAREEAKLREAQRVEALRLQEEREAEIARQAAEAAKLEAERVAEQERQAAEAARLAELERLERDRIAEAHRIEAERQAAEVRRLAEIAEVQKKAERERQEKEAAQEAARLAREQAIEQQRIDAKKLADAIEHNAAMAKQRAADAEADAKKREAIAAQVERQRIEHERLQALQAEQAKAAADLKRMQNVAHQRKINGEIVADLVSVMAEDHSGSADEAQRIAKAIVTAIAKGAIRHTSITY